MLQDTKINLLWHSRKSIDTFKHQFSMLGWNRSEKTQNSVENGHIRNLCQNQTFYIGRKIYIMVCKHWLTTINHQVAAFDTFSFSNFGNDYNENCTRPNYLARTLTSQCFPSSSASINRSPGTRTSPDFNYDIITGSQWLIMDHLLESASSFSQLSVFPVLNLSTANIWVKMSFHKMIKLEILY